MVEFHIPTKCPDLAIALVAAHGATDIVRGRKLLSYALVALPLPGWIVTCCFASASLAHFAVDVGVPASFALHLGLGCLYATARQGVAFMLLLVYMTLVHVPAHYARVFRDEEHAEGAILFSMQLTAMLAYMAPWGDTYVIDHFAQKIAIAHILCQS